MSGSERHPKQPEENDDFLFFTEDEEEEFIFADEDDFTLIPQNRDCWKLLIVDDEAEIHEITKLALSDFVFEGKSLGFLSAYSASEAKSLIAANPDTALILLDVVMESDNAGLEFVKELRDEIDNKLVRVVLRTGQPGQVPEDVVILNYDINDYKTKTELTTKKLFTCVVAALRSFRSLETLEASKQELEKIAAASARFVPREFLSILNKKSIVEATLGEAVQAEMTILFADIRSFTSISEQLSPQENFDFINDYLSRVGPIVRQYNGFIDKYIGDAVMALFPDSPADALKAAIAMQQQVNQWNFQRQKENRVPISIGIGLHKGSLMLGTIGESERMESTVISDAVNLASRLEGLTKLFGVGIVISEQTRFEIDDVDAYQSRFLGRVTVKGKQHPLAVFEIFDGESPVTRDLKIKTRSQFEQAILNYCQEQFEIALDLFDRVLQQNPRDRAAHFYYKRCQMLQQRNIPENWEGDIELMGYKF
jgi:adenylate cyclase